jgi:hypothetical protein
MPDRPTDIEARPPAKAEGSAPTRGGLVSRLFGAMPRGWVIAIFAAAAWVALILIVLGVLSLFPD